MADEWAYIFTVPASYASAEPTELSERIIDRLEDAGYTWQSQRPEVALGRLAEDNTRVVYVNTDTDPSPVFNTLVLAEVSKRKLAQRSLAQRLNAYLDNPSPTVAQNVAAIKDLIRIVRHLWQESN